MGIAFFLVCFLLLYIVITTWVCGFDKLIWIDFFFLIFFNWFFKFHYSKLNYLKIKFCDSFCFVFYKIILVSWFESQVLHVNLGLIKGFFIIFFNFIFWYLVGWELDFVTFFYLLSIGLSRYCDLGHEFGRLTHVDLSYFLCTFIIWFFFSNSSFNIELIEYCDSWFYFNLFSMDLSWFYNSRYADPSHELDKLTGVDSDFFLFFLNWFYF